MAGTWKAVAAGTALLMLAISGSTAQAAGADDEETLRFRAVQVEETELDLGASGFSQGDQIVFADDLRRGGHRIGTDAGVCTVARVTGDPEFTCVTTFRLPRGMIATQAHLRASQLPTVRLAITGGTGAYAGADGQGRTVAGDNAPVVLRLDD